MAASSGCLPLLPSLREIIHLFGLRAQKHLSQNFLLQPSSINSLVNCAGSLRDACVLEVGPGPGGLTRAILRQKPRHLVVVELDRRFLPSLEELRLYAAEIGVKMDIYRGDIRQVNTEGLFPIDSGHWTERWDSSLVADSLEKNSKKVIAENSKALIEHESLPPRPPKLRIIGNLPFNISTPLLIDWLENIANRRQIWKFGRVPMTLTFQKEICERLVADIWDEQRSRLSVMTQALCEVKFIKIIPGSAFVPVPKVDAGVVRITPLSKPLITVPFPYMEKLIRHSFQFRQKLIVRCIETLFPPDRPDLVVQIFKEAAVHPMKRSFQLSNEEYRDLCESYSRICCKNEGIFEYEYRSRINLPDWNNRKFTQRNIMGHALTANSVKADIKI